jgi:hypothetical protein
LVIGVLPSTTRAQTYPIDCAILLCLAGGWPASVHCNRARAEFIRRITPWPVEPPLQIWRCPMGASYGTERHPSNVDRIFEALFHDEDYSPRQSFPGEDDAIQAKSTNAVWRSLETEMDANPADFVLRLVQDRADIDVSGPEFNFVRSIRVFDVRYARQYNAGSEGDCERSANIFLGTYDTQGGFSWQRSSTAALPTTHLGLERWGQRCPSIYHRSVFVDWRDYSGNYGYEQVNY